MPDSMFSEVQITSENFEQTITAAQGIVIVDFYAEWCQPCKILKPMLHELAEKHDVKLCLVNVDDEHELAVRFSVTALPTVVFMNDGQETERMMGVRMAGDFEDAIVRNK